MSIQNSIPILNIILGCFLFIFILLSKNNLGKNKYARNILATIVLIYTVMSFSTYFSFIKEDGPLFIMFLSFITSHLIGFLLFYFINTIINTSINFNLYFIIVGIYTTVRVFAFLYIKREIEFIGGMDYFLKPRGSYILQFAEIDYIFTCIFNLFFCIKAIIVFKKNPLVMILNKPKEMYYKWVLIVLIINIILFSFMLLNIFVAIYDFDFLPLLIKTKPLLYTTFFIVLAYSIMSFPVFAFTGKHEDLQSVIKQKYKNSTLLDSSNLFKKIDDLVRIEKLYLNSELKLNTISENLGKSIPYISQAINENTQKSFPDYINYFRIEEAKKMLLAKKPDTIFAIALDVGFNSKAAFYNAFKKMTNTTPTGYRNQNFIN